MLSSTIPPLIANVISVTLTCVCLAFFDWRMALALFATMPITFLIIWAGRNLQIRMFDRQVGIKLEASSQIQEYLEGIKIIKSCGLSGERFSTLNRALLAMKKVAIQAELVSGVLVQSAALILQASLGIAIFVGTVLITGGPNRITPIACSFDVLHSTLWPYPCHSFSTHLPLPFRDSHKTDAYASNDSRDGGKRAGCSHIRY